MEVHQARMSDILRGFRDSILRHRNGFVGNMMPDFIKIGFLGQSPIFPAVSIVPSAQRIVERRANREYIIAREIAIQIYDTGESRATASGRLQRHVATFNLLFRKYREHFLRDENGRKTAFNFDWGQQVMPAEPANIAGIGFVMEGLIVLTVYSKSYRPIQSPTKPRKYLRVDTETAFSHVFDYLAAQRFGGKLSIIENLISGEGVLRGTGLNASLRIAARSPLRYAAGMDLEDTQYEAILWNRMLPDQASLIVNSDTAEEIFELIDVDETFAGVFWDSNLDSIQWRQRQESKNDPPYYETIVAFTCRKPELTLEGTR